MKTKLKQSARHAALSRRYPPSCVRFRSRRRILFDRLLPFATAITACILVSVRIFGSSA